MNGTSSNFFFFYLGEKLDAPFPGAHFLLGKGSTAGLDSGQPWPMIWRCTHPSCPPSPESETHTHTHTHTHTPLQLLTELLLRTAFLGKPHADGCDMSRNQTAQSTKGAKRQTRYLPAALVVPGVWGRGDFLIPSSACPCHPSPAKKETPDS